jgi:hypothetical protein
MPELLLPELLLPELLLPELLDEFPSCPGGIIFCQINFPLTLVHIAVPLGIEPLRSFVGHASPRVAFGWLELLLELLDLALFVSLTPFDQTSLEPDLIQVNVNPPEVIFEFNVEHFVPAFGAAARVECGNTTKEAMSAITIAKVLLRIRTRR